MRFENIIKTLEKENHLEFQSYNLSNNLEINKIRLLEEWSPEDHGILYIGNIYEFESLVKRKSFFQKPYRNIAFILGVEENNTDNSLPMESIDSLMGSLEMKNSVDYAAIPEKLILKVDQLANRLLNSQTQSNHEIAELLALTMKGTDLKRLLEFSSQKLKNPLVVIDSGFRIIATSQEDIIADPIWNKNIQRGYCSYEFIKEVHRLEKKGPFPENSSVFQVKCEFSLYNKLCSKIFWKDKLVGYVIMLEVNKANLSFSQELLPFVGSSVCDILLRTDEYKRIFGSKEENLLYELIHGAEEDHIQIQLKINQVQLHENMVCIIIRPNEYLSNIHAETFLKERLNQILPRSNCMKEKENLIILCKAKQDGRIDKIQEEKLSSLFNEGVLHIGISNSFNNIMELKGAYHQCLHLYKVSLKLRVDKKIMYFSDFGFYLLLSRLKENDLMQYSHPALKILRSHDHLHNSELYKTLHALVSCQFQMTKTAEVLSIHRNSLSYRVNKILDLTGVDIEDNDEIFRLGYAFKIEKYCRVSK
ncbi:PucR family transcriptional regulator [Gudongella sp. DL1XJH-153]|uniref:PucR family transcriptional regulator n=1 Tax=Gudongella sp. DL1XJH-153 TaxID=3409804 RepID=UPI003BB68913